MNYEIIDLSGTDKKKMGKTLKCGCPPNAVFITTPSDIMSKKKC